MATHTLDVDAFRAAFPAYANPVTYPDATIQIYWDLATTYISACDNWALNGGTLQSALNFLTAHLLYLAGLAAAGQPMTIVRGSTVDKVSVQLEPPPIKSAWEWWLSTSPYGVSLWALLSVKSAGGFYVPGNPERAPFRKVGGRFW